MKLPPTHDTPSHPTAAGRIRVFPVLSFPFLSVPVLTENALTLKYSVDNANDVRDTVNNSTVYQQISNSV